MTYSYELETQLLAGLIKYPERYYEIESFISEKDFFSQVSKINRTIFLVIKQALENKENINELILSERVKSLNISFEDNINVSDYINSLSLKKLSKESVVDTAKELKKLTIKREISDTCLSISRKVSALPPSSSFVEIVETADKLYNEQINLYEIGATEPKNLYDMMEDLIEERGNNPIQDFGMDGPHQRLQEIYGSLLRPGNITVVVARSGVGKMMPNHCKIKVPGGWKTHGSISKGSEVECPDGSIAKVIGVFPQGEKTVFKIFFEDGRSAECGEEHLWKIKPGENGNWIVAPTKEIVNCLKKKIPVFIPLIDRQIDKSLQPNKVKVNLMNGSLHKPVAKQIQDFKREVWSNGGVCWEKEVIEEGAKKIELTSEYNEERLQITKIVKLHKKKECTCIMIDHPDHLYITDDYIVTHNTQFALDYITKASIKHGIPILHFDNGEMSEEELIMRQCAALSGVPLYLLETGNWRQSTEENVRKVRSVWPIVKKIKLYYYNVGGMNVDSQISLLKRFYFSKIGRGNGLIFNFDYIKTTYEITKDKSEYQIVGELVDKYKKCIQREIVDDKGPLISMFTSVQSNRSGISTNRQSANVIDDESIVSLSDRITQFSSHMFILRPKTNDELLAEPGYGTHKLINVKSRHLGKDAVSHFMPVKMPDGGLKKNFINLDFHNFAITEKGDLNDISDALLNSNSVSTSLLNSNNDDSIPDMQ